ncbi:hypothetical protein V8F33_012535 [Rhypophila sp. PSN 637]
MELFEHFFQNAIKKRFSPEASSTSYNSGTGKLGSLSTSSRMLSRGTSRQKLADGLGLDALLVDGSSLLENVALVPFTKQWMIRASKAPNQVEVSTDALSVLSLTGVEDNQNSSPATVMTMNSPAPLDPQAPLLTKTNGAVDSDDIELGPVPTIGQFTRRETDKSTGSVVEDTGTSPLTSHGNDPISSTPSASTASTPQGRQHTATGTHPGRPIATRFW